MVTRKLIPFLLVLGLAQASHSENLEPKLLKLQNGAINLTQGMSLQNFDRDTKDYVVQFKNNVTETDKIWLRSKGFPVLGYLPDDAFVVQASGPSVLSLVQTNQDRLLAAAVFQPTWKLDEVVVQALTAQHFLQEGQELPLSILCFNVVQAKAVFDHVQQITPNAVLEGRLITTSAAPKLVREISQLPGVEYVQMQPLVQLMHAQLLEPFEVQTFGNGDYSDLNGFETGTKVMKMDSAWGKGFRGQGQIVSFADTGLDRGALDTVSADFKGSVSQGINFGIGAKNWADPMGHGTHVAGSIASRGVISGGILRGAADQAQLQPQGMWSPLLENLTVPPKLEKLFTPARAGGAFLHSNSWGSPANLGVYDNMAVQVDEFSFNNQDFLPIFAAGNSGVDKNKDGIVDPGSVSTPGTSKNALTVGASENLLSTGGIQKKISELRNAQDNWGAEPIASSKLSDNIDGVAVFSSRGPARDGRLKPEVVAPGTNILSNKSQEPGAVDLWGPYNKDYVYSGGTSMATPLAAGAAAVIREILVKDQGIQQPSAALVKASIMHMATDMSPGQYGTGVHQELRSRPENNQGYGRVDMERFMALKSASKFIQNNGVGTGESFELRIPTTKGQRVTATMVYSDAPGTPAAGQALTNDLDLSVNGVTKSDRINNNEHIEASASGGDTVVKVTGVRVPMGKSGKQPFAIVVTVQ